MVSERPPAHGFPGGQALQVVQLCRRWEVEPEQLLGPLGLDETELAEPGARVAPEAMIALFRRARSLTGEPGIGIYLGLQKRIAMYGFLGLATMTSATMREALEGIVQLSASVSTAITLRLRTEGDFASLTVEEHLDMGDTRDIVTFSFFVGMRQIASDLLGEQVDAALELNIPRPAYFDRFESMLTRVRFDQPVHRVLIPLAALDRPLSSPDKATMNLARERCEQSLVELGFDRSFVAEVRHQLFGARGARSLDEVASCLGLSQRTLKRRLAEQGSTFTEVRDQECCERAQHLLQATSMPLAEIAEDLGYSTLPNFARAFRRWTDQTPAGFRQAARERAGSLLGAAAAPAGPK